MSFVSVTFEQFADAPLLSEDRGVDPREAYLEGYAAGEAAALERLAESRRAFADAAQSLDEALQALKPSSERALSEALHTVFAALLPILAERGFAVEAAGAIARAFAGKSVAEVTIFIHPEQKGALAEALAAAPGAPAFAIEADPSVPPAAARIVCGKGGLDFDLAAASEACLAALTAATRAMESGT